MTHFLIIAADFYKDISALLIEGAKTELEKHGVTHEVVTVPGCLEIPPALAMASEVSKYDGFVILGCVIRGETTHYDHVCQESMHGVTKLATKFALALGNKILTCENYEQALIRADPNQKDSGGVAANAALKLLELQNHFDTMLIEELESELDDDELAEEYEL